MGFSNIVSQVVLFMSILMVIVALSVIYTNYVSSANSALEDQQKQIKDKIDTSFEILNASYSDNQIKIYLKNTGSVSMDPEKMDLYIGTVRISRDDSNLSKTLVEETNLINPMFFDADEIMFVAYNQTGLSGNHLVRISGENGVVRSALLEA